MTYAELKERFDKKYNVVLSIDKIANNAKKDEYLNEALGGKRNSLLTTYTNVLVKALSQCIEGNTEMSEKGKYGLKGFKMTEFVEEFEELLAARNMLNGESNRKPYLGLKFTDVLDSVVANTQKMNKKLGELWAERVLKKGMSVDQMKTITDVASKNLSEVKNPKQLNEDGMHSLTNIIFAKNAMVQIREKRGFLWKLFNRKENAMEKQYLKDLKMQIDRLAVKKFPVSEAIMANSNPVLKDAYWDVEVYKNPEMAKFKTQEKVRGNDEAERIFVEGALEPSTRMVNPVQNTQSINPPSMNKKP